MLIVGAGPAGAVAATVLARAGARVCLIDRATFPRPKLCGDTLNPGALEALRRLRLSAVAEARGLRIDGMLVTGEGGLAIDGRYPAGLHGRAIGRSDLDAALAAEAVAAGAELVTGTVAREAMLEEPRRGGSQVVGIRTGANGTSRGVRAAVTIAADGRHSTIAFALGLARHPARPRRWAIGVYAEGVAGMFALGEMHIRRGSYIGVAPLPGGLVNVCLVKAAGNSGAHRSDPLATIRAALAAEPMLRDRFASARFVSAPMVLGPLAVDAVNLRPVPDGLLLAGDAAGFIDPMTGDGLRFAIRGGELAAAAALDALQHGWNGVHERLAAARRREFSSKWRFNRALRAVVGSPLAVRAATATSRVAPSIVRALILHASDCGLALQPVPLEGA